MRSCDPQNVMTPYLTSQIILYQITGQVTTNEPHPYRSHDPDKIHNPINPCQIPTMTIKDVH